MEHDSRDYEVITANSGDDGLQMTKNEHPDLVKRFLETHVKLTDWINAHPDEAKAVLKKELERETGREFTQTLLDEAWKHVEFTYDPLSSTVRAQALAAYKAGFLKKDPDLRFLYDTKLLQEVLGSKIETALDPKNSTIPDTRCNIEAIAMGGYFKHLKSRLTGLPSFTVQ